MQVQPNKLIRFIGKSTTIMGAILAIYLAIAFLLIVFGAANEFTLSAPQKLHKTLPKEGSLLDNEFPNEAVLHLPVGNGDTLYSRYIQQDPEQIIVFLHGVAATSETLVESARMLAKATGASVITPDLRGHGKSHGRPFDLDYIGQYEDDLLAMLSAIKSRFKTDKIYIAGHSMGGGIALRYALKKSKVIPAGYILFAPNMGEGPTERKSSNTENNDPENALVVFDLKRFIGLIMLNTIGSHSLDHNAVLTFKFSYPPMIYSYRSIMSAQPIRPNTSDVALQAIQAPLVVVVGENDEVFNAANYPEFVAENSHGETYLIPDVDHNGVYESPQAFDLIGKWFQKTKH
ncbi:lysophospholipase [Psychrosphaera sp. B3R10]|uniref:alpha/beta hydrolase n=1 Tax=unclassified Psychrosphaera TaxID=2641570 RepID=UPI001C08868C|nr:MULTISPECIES: alpha/beta fold hydrolase [unclassified Psychrosphaera]MBU2881853.1 lysophospholipase [Psychrosphaera sp. I2R16]MBU2989874.1 lysophospholipase [Psychrosphaera sp. B3R10]